MRRAARQSRHVFPNRRELSKPRDCLSPRGISTTDGKARAPYSSRSNSAASIRFQECSLAAVLSPLIFWAAMTTSNLFRTCSFCIRAVM